MRRTRRTYFNAVALMFVTQAACGIGFGQVSKSGTPRDTVYSVGEVVVTATRKPGTTLEVPLAISVIDRTSIQAVRGFGLDDILSGVPGVLAQSRYGTQDVRLTIRGFGARGAGQRSNAGTTRGIRVMVDGIPETEPDGRTSFDLVDLPAAGRVEVIRSNASALWGNAAGGVINIFSNSGFETPYAGVSALFGSFGFSRQSVQAGTLIGKGRLFLSLSNTSFDGWRAHSRSNSTIFSTGIESPLDEHTRLGVYLLGGVNAFRIPGPLTEAQFANDPRQAQDDPQAYSPTFVARDERRFNRLGRIGMTLAHEFSNAHEVSVMAYVNPKYLQRSERNTYRDFTRYHFGGSAVYKLSSRFGEDLINVFQAGADGAFQDGAILFYSLQNRERGTLRTDKNEAAGNAGLFVQDEMMFGDRVSLIIGARHDGVTYTYRTNYDSDPSVKLLKERKTFSRLTPKAGITFRITPLHSIYASLGGGLEIPAGNETDPAGTFGQDSVYAINPLLDASASTTAEIGMKQVILPGGDFVATLSYDIALYWVSVKNDFIPYRGGRFYFTAGETRRMGLEAGMTLQERGGLALQGALTLSRNRYIIYQIDSVHYGRPGRSADLSGNRVAGIPDLFYSLKARYAPPWAHGIYLEAGLNGVGRYYADDSNTDPIPPYSIFNASLGFEAIELGDTGLFLRGFFSVQNVGDKRYASSAWINPDLSARGEPIYLEPGMPKNVTASLGLRWQF
ncbi:MAG: TonB-dependent receptor [Bacteroidota bacterium]